MNSALKLSSPDTHEFWEIPVLYEDPHLLALNKPSGFLTSPNHQEVTQPNLMGLLHNAIAHGKPWFQSRSLSYLMNAHRLDRDVSGVLLLAKSKSILIKLANLFASEKASTQYVALSQGMPKEDHFIINQRLIRKSAGSAHLRVARSAGKSVRTRCQVLERFAGWTLLQCEAIHDRINQVPAHLQHVGLPLVGAEFYGGRWLLLSSLKSGYRLKPGRTERPLISRAALHLEQLSFPHPATNEPLNLTAPWPKDFMVALKYLRIFAKL
jgi:RluA family pseudouridine synthase